MRQDKDAVISALRNELVYGAVNMAAVERRCKDVLAYCERSRAETVDNLIPVTLAEDEEV